MATRKSVSKLKQKSVKAKVSKAVLAKKGVSSPLQQSATSEVAKDVRVAAVPVKKKIKNVRDNFTMPKNEYMALGDLKLRSVRLGSPAKKSEILRAGVAVLSKMSETGFEAALDAIPSVTIGRPKDLKKTNTKKTRKKHK